MSNSILGMHILADFSLDINYNIGNLPIYVREGHISDFPEHRINSHWNDGLEIIYVHSGSMNIVINGITSALNPTDICIIDVGCVHYIEGIEGADCSYSCYVTSESTFTSLESVSTQYLNPLFHSFHPNASFISSDSPASRDFCKILTTISDYAQKKNPGYELYISGLLNIFIARLYELNPASFTSTATHNSNLDDSMRLILSYIHKNYSHQISTEELCDAGQISRSQCFSLFKKYTGDTPANFILKFRLAAARNQLANTDLSISQIASDCGFTHQSHLTSQFTKYFGVTPLHYRKDHR